MSDISPPTSFQGRLLTTSGVPVDNLYTVMTFEADQDVTIYLQICADERFKLANQN